MTNFTEKQINAWKWHSNEEVDGILADTAENVTIKNYKRKVEMFRLLRAANFDDVVDIHLTTFLTNLTKLPNGSSAEIRATIMNLIAHSLGETSSAYARLAETTATH